MSEDEMIEMMNRALAKADYEAERAGDALNLVDELAESLKRFLAFDSESYDRQSHRAKEIIEAKKQARAALAKATQP